MNIEGQDMETHEIFVVPTGNANITKEPYFQPISPVIKYQTRQDFDDKEAPKDSVAPIDNIQKSMEDFVA